MAGAELIGKEEMKEVMDVLETGVFMRYGFDNERKGIFKVKQLEKEFSEYCGTTYALGVTSGSSALKVALAAMGAVFPFPVAVIDVIPPAGRGREAWDTLLAETVRTVMARVPG